MNSRIHMYVCMYVCIRIHLYKHPYIEKYFHPYTHVHIHIRTYAYTIRIHWHLHIRIHIRIHINTYVIYLCIYIYVYIYIYVCMYIYICICYPDLVLWLPFADFSPPWLDFVVPASGSNLARLEWHVSRTRLTDSTFPGPRGHKLGRSDYFSDSMYYWYTKWHEYWVKKNSDMDYLVIYLQIYLVITKWLLGKLEYVTNLK